MKVVEFTDIAFKLANPTIGDWLRYESDLLKISLTTADARLFDKIIIAVTKVIPGEPPKFAESSNQELLAAISDKQKSLVLRSAYQVTAKVVRRVRRNITIQLVMDDQHKVDFDLRFKGERSKNHDMNFFSTFFDSHVRAIRGMVLDGKTFDESDRNVFLADIDPIYKFLVVRKALG